MTWYLTRSSGLLAWALLALATLWGLLSTSRLLERRPTPAWLLDLHRHLGNLVMVLTVLHVGAIVVDDFVDYAPVHVLVPFVAGPDDGAHSLGVGLGVVSLWLLAIVQLSSWTRARLPWAAWQRIHLLSAPLFVLAGLHGWLVGTDVRNPVVTVTAIVLSAEVLLVLTLRIRFGRRPLPIPATGST